MSPSDLQSFNFDYKSIGVGLLESITIGLYRNAEDILREYISNEVDNDPEPSRVDIEIHKTDRTVVVRGDGPGMNLDQLRTGMMIGISPKDPNTNVGFRGIGIWAGVSSCETLRIVTKSASDPLEYEVVVNAARLRSFYHDEKQRNKALVDALNETAGYRKRQTSRLPGTEVRLEGISSAYEDLLDATKVRDYVTRVCPVAFDEGFKWAKQIEKFLRGAVQGYHRTKMFLDGAPVRGLHVPADLWPPITGTISAKTGRSGPSTILGTYWLCHSHRTRIEEGFDRGFGVRVRNFLVCSPNTIHDHIQERTGTRAGTFDYWVGEIHSMSPELRPSAERNDLEKSLAKEALLDYVALDLFKEELDPVSRLISDTWSLKNQAKGVNDEGTTVSRKEYPTVDSVVIAIDETERRRQDIKEQKVAVDKKFYRLRKLPLVQYLRKWLASEIDPSYERSLRRLDAKVRHLQSLRSKLESEAAHPAPEGKTESPGELTGDEEEGTGTEAETAPISETETETTTAEPHVSSLAPVIAEETSRILAFSPALEPLVKAVLIAAVRGELCRDEAELRRFSGAILRALQSGR